MSVVMTITFENKAYYYFHHLQGMAGDRGAPAPGPGQYPYNGTPGPDSSYGGPDSLRNTANKMFSRGQAERSDSGYCQVASCSINSVISGHLG